MYTEPTFLDPQNIPRLESSVLELFYLFLPTGHRNCIPRSVPFSIRAIYFQTRELGKVNFRALM